MTIPNGARSEAGTMAVVVTHNSARHLETLAQALRSGTSIPARLLAVDNDSSDDTVAVARALGFEVHESRSNDGFGSACNIAVRMASTEFLLICNPDVVPSATALALLEGALRADPDAAVAGAAFDKPNWVRRFSRLSGNLWTFLPRRLQGQLEGFEPEMPVDPDSGQVAVDFVVGAFMLCRVAALRVVGGFDEEFFLYSEEEDLCRRLGEVGWRTVFVPAVRTDHAHSTSSAGVDGAMMAPFQFHSLYRYYRKHEGLVYAEFARAVLAACVVIDRCYRGLRGRPQAYGSGTATAPFLSIGAVRRGHEKRLESKVREGGDG